MVVGGRELHGRCYLLLLRAASLQLANCLGKQFEFIRKLTAEESTSPCPLAVIVVRLENPMRGI